MSTSALAVRDDAPVPLAATDYQALRAMAADLIASGYLPKSIARPEQAVAIVMLGRELGMGPWQAINSIDVIQGRPTVNARGMSALVKRFLEPRGGYLRVVESTYEQATVEYLRPPEPEPRRVTFTIEEARAANLLGKDTWKQYPVDMLRNRAISRACREGFPDVVLGLYTAEEVESTAPAVAVVSAFPTASEPIGTAPADADDEAVARLMKRLHAEMAKRTEGDGHAVLHQLAWEKYGVESMTDLDLTQLQAMLGHVLTLPIVKAGNGGNGGGEKAGDPTSWTELWHELGRDFGLRGIAAVAQHLDLPIEDIRARYATPDDVRIAVAEEARRREGDAAIQRAVHRTLA
jgi:hypothetical protein